jgi:hypothetical protein
MLDYKLAKAKELATRFDILLPAVEISLPKAAIYSNLRDFDADFSKHYEDRVFSARVAQPTEIGLATFPSNTYVSGSQGFPVLVDGVLVDEQVAPWLRNEALNLSTLLNEAGSVDRIEPECLLLARYGEGTWGHWLAEMLPRAVLAEKYYPGRFSYIVPEWTTRSNTSGFPMAVLESLRGYGVDESRLVRISSGRTYIFDSLSLVTSVISDRVMHPLVLDIMRKNICFNSNVFGSYLPSRIAICRKNIGRRAISNSVEVEEYLRNLGFYCVEIEEMPFSVQVALFRGAHAVFCVLGSGLSGLIFSPDNVGVIAPAPGSWGDDFFYPFVQLRNGKFADIRGPVENEDSHLFRDSSFRISTDILAQVLNLMELK